MSSIIITWCEIPKLTNTTGIAKFHIKENDLMLMEHFACFEEDIYLNRDSHLAVDLFWFVHKVQTPVHEMTLTEMIEKTISLLHCNKTMWIIFPNESYSFITGIFIVTINYHYHHYKLSLSSINHKKWID